MIEQPLAPPKIDSPLGAEELDPLGAAAGRRAKVVAAGHAAADHKTTILVPPQRPKRVGLDSRGRARARGGEEIVEDI